jgi:hypothetical protein
MRDPLMFKFLKRAPAAVAKPAAKPARGASMPSAVRRPGRPSAAGSLDPLPLPQVQELHDDSAWDEWEHSQMELDSRMGPQSAFDSVRIKDASPSQLSELDPFASVRTRPRK